MEFFDKNFYKEKRRHSLTKQDVSEQIEKCLRYSAPKAKQLVEDTIEIIKSTLENGEDVMITNFGKFCVKKKQERTGRNPATNQPMTLKKRRVVTFSVSSNLKDRMNNHVLEHGPHSPYNEKM